MKSIINNSGIQRRRSMPSMNRFPARFIGKITKTVETSCGSFTIDIGEEEVFTGNNYSPSRKNYNQNIRYV